MPITDEACLREDLHAAVEAHVHINRGAGVKRDDEVPPFAHCDTYG